VQKDASRGKRYARRKKGEVESERGMIGIGLRMAESWLLNAVIE